MDAWTLLLLMMIFDWALPKKPDPDLTAAKELLKQMEKENER